MYLYQKQFGSLRWLMAIMAFSLEIQSKEKGLTVVPLEIYVSKYGKIKALIGLAKGKTTYDKREDLKKKDIKRELEREGF